MTSIIFHLVRNLIAKMFFFVSIIYFGFAIALLFLGCGLGRFFRLGSYFLVLGLRQDYLEIMIESLDQQDIVIYFYLILFVSDFKLID